MKLYVVAVGRLADPALRAACQDYATRVRRVWHLEIREVRSPTGRFPPAERMRREALRLLEAIPAGSLAVALTRVGSSYTSDALARRLAGWQSAGRDAAFVMGGADGLDRRVREHCELALSLSPLTFPHELARVMLLEQIYRATTILRRTPYHRGR